MKTTFTILVFLFSIFTQVAHSQQRGSVTLSDLSSVVETNKIKITWTTLNEINPQHYDVEHSQDGFFWQKITQVIATGTPDGLPAIYNYEHETASKGINYYRITYFDQNNSSEVLSVFYVDNPSEIADLMPHPNPSKEFITLPITLPDNCEVNISVFDLNGRLIRSNSAYMQQGVSEKTLDVSDLPQGTHVIHVSCRFFKKSALFMKN